MHPKRTQNRSQSAVRGRSRVLWLVTGAAVLALAVPAAARGGAKLIDKATRKFDHAAHDKAVASKGKGKTAVNPACDGICHEPKGEGWAKTGADEHDRCLGCHPFTNSRRELNSGRFNWCFSCHEGGKRMPATAPRQETIAKSWAAAYSHKAHIRPGSKSGKQCEACHGEFGDGQPNRGPGVLAAGHEFCGGCHERAAEPSMNECKSCHVSVNSPRGKNPVVEARAANPYAVGALFDHRKHAGQVRVGTKGRECLVCHDNIAKAARDTEVPAPTMQGCYDNCHNGKDGFDATGTTCTKCHSNAAGGAR